MLVELLSVMNTTAYNKLSGGKNFRGTQAGFTLIETMIAVAIIGIVFVTLYLGISSCYGVVQLNRENVRATQVLQEKMEVVRLFTWDQVTNNVVPHTFTTTYYPGKPGGATYMGTVTITKMAPGETYADNLREVRIQVRWTSGNVLRKREMTTLISQYGLQNYLY